MKLFSKRNKVDITVEEVNLSVEEALKVANENVKDKQGNAKISPKLEKKAINYSNVTECLEYVKEECEQITLAKKQLLESKIEYGAVTAYLADIQKIDNIPIEEKQKLCDAARNIVNLTDERNKIQNRKLSMPEMMYKHLEKYEDLIPDEIAKMEENEAYEGQIKDDMRHLEGEKAVLNYDKDELIAKKSYIKNIAIVVTAIIFVLFIAFLVFQQEFDINVETPLLLTILVGVISVALLFIENNRNNAQMRLNDKKINRCVALMNKVKIKYINNRNNLDYAYQKYRVNASKELAYLWKQYVVTKDENRRYKKNTELLEFYNLTLQDELDRFQVEDTEIWTYQPLGIIDDKEMVEIRHRLNNRRQKLREQIDYNNNIIEESKQEILVVIKKHPNEKMRMEQILKENDAMEDFRGLL